MEGEKEQSVCGVEQETELTMLKGLERLTINHQKTLPKNIFRYTTELLL